MKFCWWFLPFLILAIFPFVTAWKNVNKQPRLPQTITCIVKEKSLSANELIPAKMFFNWINGNSRNCDRCVGYFCSDDGKIFKVGYGCFADFKKACNQDSWFKKDYNYCEENFVYVTCKDSINCAERELGTCVRRYNVLVPATTGSTKAVANAAQYNVLVPATTGSRKPVANASVANGEKGSKDTKVSGKNGAVESIAGKIKHNLPRGVEMFKSVVNGEKANKDTKDSGKNGKDKSKSDKHGAKTGTKSFKFSPMILIVLVFTVIIIIVALVIFYFCWYKKQ